MSAVLCLYVSEVSLKDRLQHNVDYLLKHGCGQGVIPDTRNPADPY